MLRIMLRSSAAVFVILSLVSGCGTIEKRELEYKQAEPLPTLEVPPDLLSLETGDQLATATAPLGGTVSLSELNRAQPEVAETPSVPVGIAQSDNVRIGRDAAARWLIVTGEPGKWWEPVKEFLSGQGATIKRENPTLGLIETEWLENRGEITVRSFFSKTFDKLYSASTRDQYVVRMEHGAEPSTTELHIAHRGMRQVAVGESLRWLPRPSEAELEIEMLKRLVLFITGDEGRAEELAMDAEEPQLLAQLQHGEEGEVWLQVSMDFARAWGRIGDALSRMQITIEDYNRATGHYFVTGVLAEPKEKKGFFSRLFRGGEDQEQEKQFRVNVVKDGVQARIFLLDKDGKMRDDSKAAEAFLGRLEEQLNN